MIQKTDQISNRVNLSIIVPVLNEEESILSVIDSAFSAMREFGLDGEIIVVNDGSTDSTAELVQKKIKENSGIVKMITHKFPLGIGASFWDGIDMALGEAVVLIPGDNENDPREILCYYKLLEDVDIVVPFIFNQEIRSFSRKLFSFLFRFIVNFIFFVNFNYTNGTIIYRKSLLKEISCRRNDFFFQADILIRLVKRGYLFAEVPSRLDQRKGGVSKFARSPLSLLKLLIGCLFLIRDYYFKKERKIRVDFAADSATAKRRKVFINLKK